MILNAFRVERDRCTEQDGFGYERPLWPWNCRPFQDFEPSLGSPIMVHPKLVTNIVKIIELYWSGTDPIVVERLAWLFNNTVFPYRVRYIHRVEKMWNVDPVVFLPNMSGIYRIITGNDMFLVSPLDYYLGRMVYDPDITTRIQDYAESVLKFERPRLSGIAAQETDHAALREFLTYMDSDCDPSGIEYTVMPKLESVDPLSHKFTSGGIPTRHLVCAGYSSNPFDTSPVGCIPITHPEVTVYSPEE